MSQLSLQQSESPPQPSLGDSHAGAVDDGAQNPTSLGRYELNSETPEAGQHLLLPPPHGFAPSVRHSSKSFWAPLALHAEALQAPLRVGVPVVLYERQQ
jgi:hypothetical protein